MNKQHLIILLLCCPFINSMEQHLEEDINHQIPQAQNGLVPDDIVSPTRWTRENIEDLNLPEGLFTKDTKIRRRDHYQPGAKTTLNLLERFKDPTINMYYRQFITVSIARQAPVAVRNLMALDKSIG